MPSLDALIRNAELHWPAIYLNRQQQLGSTAALMNFGDTRTAGKLNAVTFTGYKFNASGLSPVWTPSAVLSAFATK